jgi:hypothetical protein
MCHGRFIPYPAQIIRIKLAAVYQSIQNYICSSCEVRMSSIFIKASVLIIAAMLTGFGLMTRIIWHSQVVIINNYNTLKITVTIETSRCVNTSQLNPRDFHDGFFESLTRGFSAATVSHITHSSGKLRDYWREIIASKGFSTAFLSALCCLRTQYRGNQIRCPSADSITLGNVFSQPLPISDRLLWLHYFGLQPPRHVIISGGKRCGGG